MNKLEEMFVTTVTSTFKSETYLEVFLENCLDQSLFHRTIFSLNMSEPSIKELQIVRRFKPYFGSHLKVSRHKKRIPIYQAWNEICLQAKSPFLAIWNVDDSRSEHSLESQYSKITSDEFTSVSGPFVIIDKYGESSGLLADHSKASSSDWLKGMLYGPFFMFKREDLKILKGFDEQFEVAADFDFAMRLQSLGPVGYTDDILGFYLNAQLGVSTKPDSRLAPERECIYLRYGVVEKLDLKLLIPATRFDINKIHVGDSVYSLDACSRNIQVIIDSQTKLLTLRSWIKHLRRIRRSKLQVSLFHYARHPLHSARLLMKLLK